MAVTRVESLVYGVNDLAAGINYYQDWGLEILEKNSKGAIFATPVGQTIYLLDKNDSSLPSAPSDNKSTVRKTVWGVDSEEELEKISVELSRDRKIILSEGNSFYTRDESGFPIGFCLSQPIQVDIAPPEVNTNENSKRLNKVISHISQAKPFRIGHVVYFIPKEQSDTAVSFYIDRLGFRLSDRTIGRGDFMRCPQSRDHHNLFLLQRSGSAEFNHAAFEVKDFDEIMMGGEYMKKHGWMAATNPGRHILGSNLYWYFSNPSGGNTEYFADMDCMDDNWKPRIWDKNPGFSLWSIDTLTNN